MRGNRGGGAERQGGDRAVGSCDRARTPADSRTDGGRRGQQPAGEGRVALRLQHRRGDRDRTRSAPFRLPDRLWRLGDLPVSGLCLALRNGTRRPGQEQARRADGAELSQGHQQGSVQDHLEDGDFDDLQLSWRTAVRDRRPAPGHRGPVFRRHGVADPGLTLR